MPQDKSSQSSQLGLFETAQEPRKRDRTKTMRVPENVKSKAAKTQRKSPINEQQQKPSSGLVPEGDVRLTANIREDLHLKLKIAAARRRTTIGEIIEELVDKFV